MIFFFCARGLSCAAHFISENITEMLNHSTTSQPGLLYCFTVGISIYYIGRGGGWVCSVLCVGVLVCVSETSPPPATTSWLQTSWYHTAATVYVQCDCTSVTTDNVQEWHVLLTVATIATTPTITHEWIIETSAAPASALYLTLISAHSCINVAMETVCCVRLLLAGLC